MPGFTKSDLQAFVRKECGEAVAKALKDVQEQIGTRGADQVRELAERGSDARKKQVQGAGLVFGGVCAALALTKGNVGQAIDLATKGAKDFKADPIIAKALTAGDAASGGFLLAPEMSDEIIELLLPRTTVRKHIDNVQELSSGQINVPKLTSGAAVSWGAEVAAIQESAEAFGQVALIAKQEKVLIPVSNTLMRRGGPRVQAIVRNDALRQMTIGEDSKFLRGDGTGSAPKGLRFWANTANIVASTGVTNALITADLLGLITKLQTANVPMTKPWWTFSPRSLNAIMGLQTTTGAFVYRDELAKGTLFGIPYDVTTQVPVNLGSGKANSEVYLADGDELALGQGPQLQIALSEDATFVDANNKTISAFQRDLTLLRVINEVDLVARHDLAIAILKDVAW
jgi:HK97 family phage major capsid protein